MLPYSFLLPLLVRSTSLLLPQTFFQPDEFYQALEPAHKLVFGNGYSTWEWKDLPATGDDLWSVYVAGGRMRGWIWPGIFALLYRGLSLMRLDQTFLITFLPRVLGVIIAAGTDYATSRLGSKLTGPGAASGALFLSLTSLFNAHLLPRALSTSPETFLTALALVYFPLPAYIEPKEIAVGHPPRVSGAKLNEAKIAPDSKEHEGEENSRVRFESISDIDYAVMDRMHPQIRRIDHPTVSLTRSVALASLALCIRPTLFPFWTFLAAELCIGKAIDDGLGSACVTAATGLVVFATTVAASTALDFAITGRLMIPMLTFIHQNVFCNISAFYGNTNLSYHFVQSLPIMLFPIWIWWAPGFAACLLPSSWLPKTLAMLDRPPGMRALARALTFTLAILSLSPHSEWRFLHPLLPSLLLYALPVLHRQYTPSIFGCYRLIPAIRQYTRFQKPAFYICLLAPIVPWLYLNTAHGRAQVEVMNVLRRGELGNVSGLVVLAPCHSTPWSSHLHADVEGWFLTCEPPLHDNPFDHITQQAMFYQAPVTYLQSVFPLPPGPLHHSTTAKGLHGAPSHIIVFGELLERSEVTATGNVTVSEALLDLGYNEVWHGWNGFDAMQDEMERRGGVRVWSR